MTCGEAVPPQADRALGVFALVNMNAQARALDSPLPSGVCLASMASPPRPTIFALSSGRIPAAIAVVRISVGQPLLRRATRHDLTA